MKHDAVVIGSGPNGLAAAIVLAQAGLKVLVLEAAATAGGGARTAELTLPGFRHDVCSTVHPLAASSPFLRTLPLSEHGLEWVVPPACLAHPLDEDAVVLLHGSVSNTSDGLGADAEAYRRLMAPLVLRWRNLWDDLLGPLGWPAHPLTLARFGLRARFSARRLVEKWFQGERARSLFGGLAAHSTLALEDPFSAAFGLVLAIAGHAVGWPMPRGGAQAITDALVGVLDSLGGEIRLGSRIDSIDDLPVAAAILCDITPRQLLGLAKHRLPEGYARRLEAYRYGPAAFKIDWALDGPVPWRAAECVRSGTVHIGGRFSEIAESERSPWWGKAPESPFVLLAQPSLFDETRAPEGKHVVWAYCHVPNDSTVDMTDRIESQIERFAPGFRAKILKRHVLSPRALERYNPNLVGGDISGGSTDWRQLFFRPTRERYVTPVRGLYLCSSSTPPGGGVHGMCGYHAAREALKRL